LTFSSIQQYHQQLLNRTTSCVSVVDFFLQQIEKQSALNAFVAIYAEEAIEKAKVLDELRANGQPLGKLHGVVIALKDVICYKDHLVTAASKILQGFTATYNATVVEKLLAEQAIIIGTCNCDEFAMGSSNENSFYGPTYNAIDTTRVPGGSSGGSAVAVQANCCMVSLGSDTGGSVRQPADFCGIIGLKPTYGRVSRYGLIAYGSSFDQIGIFGKDVSDVATVLEVIAGEDNFDSTAAAVPVPHYTANLNNPQAKPTKPLRIGYFVEALHHKGLDAEIGDTITAYLKKLEGEGHSIQPIHFDLLEYIVPTYYVLTTAEASSNLSRYDGVRYGHRSTQQKDLTEFYTATRSEGFGMEVKRRILLGTFVLSEGYYDAYFTQAQKVRQQLLTQTNLIFNTLDAVVLPTVPSTAFALEKHIKDPLSMYLADIYTVYANLVGIPAISIPLFQHSNGLPFGLQIMTNQFSELSLLQIAQQLMQQT
jgi:aspartyl-tRNA(Asn)/glutamyl-tRNA(Gln) amidotransferase subunit A